MNSILREKDAMWIVKDPTDIFLIFSSHIFFAMVWKNCIRIWIKMEKIGWRNQNRVPDDLRQTCANLVLTARPARKALRTRLAGDFRPQLIIFIFPSHQRCKQPLKVVWRLWSSKINHRESSCDPIRNAFRGMRSATISNRRWRKEKATLHDSLEESEQVSSQSAFRFKSEQILFH